jgi:hypothetical protein
MCVWMKDEYNNPTPSSTQHKILTVPEISLPTKRVSREVVLFFDKT